MRDRALLAVALGCGLRRAELAILTIEHIQKIDGRWVIVNILGKRNKLRTVKIPAWTKQALDAYLDMVGIKSGRLFRAMSKSGRVLRDRLSSESIKDIVNKYTDICGFDFAPHDLCRTYAKLSYKNGARLDQIQINLGHASLTTTQRYLGNELDLADSPGDYINISIA